MATKTRKLSVEISGEDRSAGKTFKEVGRDADKLGDDLEKSGEKASGKFSKGFKSLGSKMAGIGEKVAGLFKKAAIAGFAAAGIAATAAFANHLDTEAAEKKLSAQLGGGEWGERAGRIAGDLYLKGFGDSVGDTGEAVRGVLQHGLVFEDASAAEIEEITELALTFSDVLDQDLNMSIQAVSNMLRTGLAKDAKKAFDILTRGVQQGADRAGDLAETFQEYSTLFRDVGIDAVEATGLMVQGLSAGARDADKVADAIKEFAIRAQDGSKTSADAFKLIGLNAEEMTNKVAQGGPLAREALDQVLDGLRNMTDPVERNAAAVGLFGAQAEDLGDALFALDLDTAAQQLGTMDGATGDLTEAYDTLQQKIETFKRQALEKIVTFTEENVIPVLQSFKDWVVENQDAIKIFGVVLGAFVGTALLAYIIGMAMAAIATIAATWPILAVIAVVAALAAGLIWVKNRWDDTESVVYKFRYALETVVGWIQKVWGWIMNLTVAIVGLADQVGRALGPLGDLVGMLAGGGGGGGLLGTVLGTVTNPVGTGARFLGGLLGRRAGGGPVTAGHPYVVGEEGFELFVPRQSGTIVPHDLTSNMVMANAGGGSVSNTFRIEVNVPPNADPAAAGQATVEAIRAYERRNGTGWRR